MCLARWRSATSAVQSANVPSLLRRVLQPRPVDLAVAPHLGASYRLWVDSTEFLIINPPPMRDFADNRTPDAGTFAVREPTGADDTKPDPCAVPNYRPTLIIYTILASFAGQNGNIFCVSCSFRVPFRRVLNHGRTNLSLSGPLRMATLTNDPTPIAPND